MRVAKLDGQQGRWYKVVGLKIYLKVDPLAGGVDVSGKGKKKNEGLLVWGLSKCAWWCHELLWGELCEEEN